MPIGWIIWYLITTYEGNQVSLHWQIPPKLPPKLAGLSVERPAHHMQGALPFFSCVTRDRKSSKIRWCLFLYLKISAIFAPTSNKKHVDKSFFELRKKIQLFLWKDRGFFESNICNSQKVEKDEKWKMSNQTAKVRIGHQWYVMFNQPQCPWNSSRNSSLSYL